MTNPPLHALVLLSCNAALIGVEILHAFFPAEPVLPECVAWVLLGCCLGVAWVLLGCCLGVAWVLLNVLDKNILPKFGNKY